ncbi:MAG: NAD(P)H-hydrate epimerase [Candidatus Bathyarchaeota archaeon]|nr:MAG: NAD(P)H-hydrate epimerase [Candidatus Bathyarchaeota archaeon]
MINVTAEEMRRIDKLATEKYGIRLEQMMELAGYHLADMAKGIFNGSLGDKRVLVLSGKGNNGAGGLVCARHIMNRGGDVTVVIPARAELSPVTRGRLETLEILDTRVFSFRDFKQLDKASSEADLIIDSLIGYGLVGDPRPPISEMIEWANYGGVQILSLDIPSGLDTTTGKAHSPCIMASSTLTLALPKKELLAEGAREYVGGLYLADIGIPPFLYKEIGFDVGEIFREDGVVRLF